MSHSSNVKPVQSVDYGMLRMRTGIEEDVETRRIHRLHTSKLLWQRSKTNSVLLSSSHRQQTEDGLLNLTPIRTIYNEIYAYYTEGFTIVVQLTF